eukprot:sb/3471047/
MIPPSPASSSKDSAQEIVYPIEIPALGGCKLFLEAVKVIDEDPRFVSCLQFVDSLMYCCEVYGDIQDIADVNKLSPEIGDAITTVMDKIRRQTSRGLFGLADIFIGQFWGYPLMKNFLEQYVKGKQENVHSEVHYSMVCQGTIVFPVTNSKNVFFKLNNVSCDESYGQKQCKVAVNVSVALKMKYLSLLLRW